MSAIVITIKVMPPPGARVTALHEGVLIETDERMGFVPYSDLVAVAAK